MKLSLKHIKVIYIALFSILILSLQIGIKWFALNLDTTSYAHIANQVAQGNFHALLNLTWSPLPPLIASLFIKFGIHPIIAFHITNSFALIALISLYAQALTKDNLLSYIVLGFLTITIGPGFSDAIFLFFFIFIFKEFNQAKTSKNHFIKLALLSIPFGFARSMGFYVMIFALLLYIALYLYEKNFKIARNYAGILLLNIIVISLWSMAIGKEHNIPPTLNKTGAFNLTLLPDRVNNTIPTNMDDKAKITIDNFHSYIHYNPKQQFIPNNRNTHQWRWLDIASFTGTPEIPKYPATWNAASIQFMIKYYFSNVYVFIKDYTFTCFIFFLLFFSNLKNFRVLIPLTVLLFYINLFFITHLEERYILPCIILLVTLVIENKNNIVFKFLKNTQIPLIILLSLSTHTLRNLLHASSASRTIFQPTPGFYTQKIDKPMSFIAFSNVETATLVIQNPNLIFKGYLYPNEIHTVTDTTLYLMEAKGEKAVFIPVKEYQKTHPQKQSNP